MKRVDQVSQKYLKKAEKEKKKNKLLSLVDDENFLNKLKKITLLVSLIACFIMGFTLIAFGVVKSNTADISKKVIKTESETRSDIEKMNEELSKLRSDLQEEYSVNAISEKYYNINNEIIKKEGELSDASAELWKIQTGVYERMKGEVLSSNMPVILVGVSMLLLSVYGASYYLKKYRFSLKETK